MNSTAWRTSLAIGATLLSACGGGSELTLTLKLSDAVFTASSSTRIVISSPDVSFPAEDTLTQIDTGLLVGNRDVDGDGRVDIVIETTKDFDLAQLAHFVVKPHGVTTPINVVVRAETLDAHHARVSRIGGGARDATADHVSAVLSPHGATTAPTLEPACVGTCPDPTASYGPGDVTQTIDLTMTPATSLASGSFEAAGQTGLVIGAAEASSPAVGVDDPAPLAGRIELWSGVGAALTQKLVLDGLHAGDRFGAALAAGDLDGDGITDLIVGAPGVDSGTSVWVLYGPLTNQTLAGPDVAQITATGSLGASLALEDLDGDGNLEVVVGQPGADQVLVFEAAQLGRGTTLAAGDPTTQAILSGVEGSQFGASVSARASSILVGAPLEGMGTAYYVPAAGVLAPGSRNVSAVGATRWIGAGGEFGSTVALSDIDGSGTLALFVGSPLDGAGRIFSRPAAPLVAGDADASNIASLTGAIASGGFGAQIALVRSGLGDELLFGSGASTTVPGALYAMPGIEPSLAPVLVLGTDGNPADVVVAGGTAGDAFGTTAVAGDFNADGVLDLAIGTATSVAIVTGPIL